MRLAQALGWALGPPGYWCTAAFLNGVNPGARAPLPARAKRILDRCYTAFFPSVDLDRIRLRCGARFPGVPVRPAGMALGHTIYLRQSRFDECDCRDMLLLIHELVHVAQFVRGTWTSFARDYAAGLLRHLSYHANPLEREARAFTESHAMDVSQALAELCGHAAIIE
ncbi:MAG TPA: hypothetical protein VLV45_13105 [Gemmatimonadales bacterium]|nr:hypothetical protein [Gemmatimonadales bacterium]